MTNNKSSSRLLYEQITEKVLEIIRERQLKPHDPIPSEAELAKTFGVSRMTTKLALEKLEKHGIVYRMARRGTFLADGGEVPLTIEQVSAAGNGSVTEKRALHLIAIIVPNMDDYTSHIIESVAQEARRLEYELIVKISSNEEDEELALTQLAENGHVKGIILFPRGRQKCSDEVLKLKLQGFPIVIIDRIYKEIDIDCVYHDHYNGAYQLTKFVIDRGHREIGFVSRPFSGITSREERYQGYIQALLDLGMTVSMSRIFLEAPNVVIKENFISESPELIRFIESNPNMTAVICADDYIAASLLYGARSLGIQVPQQLSIAGFSDIQLSAFLPVPLTTVRQSTEQLGQSAVKLLLNRINNSKENALTIKINTTIISRSSVGENTVTS